MSPILSQYLHLIQQKNTTSPAILDETSAIFCINTLYNTNLESIADIAHAGLHEISIFDIPPDKKHFSIEQVRECSNSIALQPYTGKHIFLLNHFDTAQDVAQNALLKSLEDAPSYAIIWLVVTTTNTLLDTITSRSINLFQSFHQSDLLDTNTTALLDDFLAGKQAQWITHLYKEKYTTSEAIALLHYVFPHIDTKSQTHCLNSIEALFSTHENPKNILDAFFLGNIFSIPNGVSK